MNKNTHEENLLLTIALIHLTISLLLQMNQITHWLDASNIYGSDARDQIQLRLGRLGRLRASQEPGKSRNPQDLPKCVAFSGHKPEMCTGCPACFVAGRYVASTHRKTKKYKG